MPSLDLLNAIPTLKDCYFRRLSIKAGKLGHIREATASPANCQERATKLFDHGQHFRCVVLAISNWVRNIYFSNVDDFG